MRIGFFLALFFSMGLFADYDPTTMCFIFPDRQVIMSNILKNASSSMRLSILDKHEHVVYFGLPKTVRKSWKKFIIVRDPIDRVISSYMEECKIRGDRWNKNVENEPFIIHREDLFISFEQYLSYLEKGFLDGHAFPQHWFLERKNLSLQDMDFILDVNNLEADFEVLSTKIGFRTLGLSLENAGDNKKKESIKNWLENRPELMNKVRKIYEEDFILYNNAKKIQEQRKLTNDFN